MNINSFSALSISVNNTLKYYDSKTLNKKLILMGGTMKLFQELLGHEIFSSMVPWVAKYFLEICKTLWPPPLLHI